MTTWVPILSDRSETAALAWDAVEAIAQAIMGKQYGFREQEKEKHPQLSYEEALLYCYLALAHNDLEWADRAVTCLNVAIDNVAQLSGNLRLFGGLAGLGWTVEHVSPVLSRVAGLAGDAQDSETVPGETEEDDPNADIDAVILRKLRQRNSTTPYDLVSGLVGFGMYFLERLPKQTAAEGVKAVFERLEDMAEHGSTGITWHSGPELLPRWQRERCPTGYYNLGVAHGIPGIIHFLSELSVTSIVEQDRTHALLDAAVNWLIAHQCPEGKISRFSSWIVPGEELSTSRLGWCYGDLGILAVLLQVVHRTKRTDWERFACSLLNHCLAWPEDQAQIGDAILCHGAAGVAHIFNRIYQREGDRRCLDAALFWYERSLAMREPGTGVGGFSSLIRSDRLAPVVQEPSPAFLDGAIGVALAFLAAVTPIWPGWDRMLQLSGKP